jgi:hypothetical protein
MRFIAIILLVAIVGASTPTAAFAQGRAIVREHTIDGPGGRYGFWHLAGDQVAGRRAITVIFVADMPFRLTHSLPLVAVLFVVCGAAYFCYRRFLCSSP